MRTLLIRLARCRSGAGAAEFAMVLPLLLVFIFGIIDAGRAMWTWNRAEKATQMGVRHAVATEMIPAGLASYSFVTSGGLPQGAPIPQSAFGGATCTVSGCVCKTGATCPPLGTVSTAAFNSIVARMQLFMAEIQPANVAVDYDYSGLGYAGDPNGPDVSPLVTVRLINMPPFQPVTLMAFGGTINFPDFRAALTLEDGGGPHAN